MTEIIGRKSIYEGKLLDLEIVTSRYQDGVESRREVVHHIPVVGIVVLQEGTDVAPGGRHVVLVRQWRAPMAREVVEIVAGLVDPGETALETARRELREETGLEAADWTELGTIFSSPGFTDERVTLFIARDLRHVGADPDDEEHLTLVTMPLSLIPQAIRRGEIQDAKSVAALLWTLHHLSES